MADLPPAGPNNAGGLGSEGRPAGAARWLTVLGIIAAALVLLLIVVAHLTGLIGPGLHGPGGPSPSSSITESPSPSAVR